MSINLNIKNSSYYYYVLKSVKLHDILSEIGVDSMDDIKIRLNEFEQEIKKTDIPLWDELPSIELYMDQVIILLNQYLAIIKNEDGESEKITKNMINNYVKMKVVPAPIKKKYSRTHIAYLVMVCFMKQVFSIAVIKKFLPDFEDEAGIERMYNKFICYIKGISVEDINNSFTDCKDQESYIIEMSAKAIMLKTVAEWLV